MIKMIHPGKILREKIFNTQLAIDFIKTSGIDPNVFSNLLQEKQNINNDIASKLATFFKTSKDYYLDMQKIFDKEKFFVK